MNVFLHKYDMAFFIVVDDVFLSGDDIVQSHDRSEKRISLVECSFSCSDGSFLQSLYCLY